MDLSLLLELDLIGLIYDAVLEPDRWSDTLDQVRRFVELQTVVLSVNALPGGELAAFGSSNIPPEFMRLLPELGATSWPSGAVLRSPPACRSSNP